MSEKRESATEATRSIAPYVEEILADGEWHYEAEIALRLLAVVPPERAMRAVASRKDQSQVLLRQIRTGMLIITRGVLHRMVEHKRVVREGPSGKAIHAEQVRYMMVDEDTLAWHKAIKTRMAQGGTT